MKYRQLPTDMLNKVTFDAGVILTKFEPKTGAVNRADIVGATSGASAFNSTPTIVNLFEDVDNARANSKQGVVITGYDPHLTTTMITVDNTSLSKLLVKCDVSTEGGVTKITPKEGVVPEKAFFDVWVIADHAIATDSDGNTTSGFFAIHLLNCINVTGFQQQTTKDGKATYSVDFRAHYDNESETENVPFEIYMGDGTAA